MNRGGPVHRASSKKEFNRRLRRRHRTRSVAEGNDARRWRSSTGGAASTEQGAWRKGMTHGDGKAQQAAAASTEQGAWRKGMTHGGSVGPTSSCAAGTGQGGRRKGKAHGGSTAWPPGLAITWAPYFARPGLALKWPPYNAGRSLSCASSTA